MTSRERILTALAHRQPDRCPSYIWYARGMREALERHLGVEGTDAVEAALKVDRWRDVGLRDGTPEALKEHRRRLAPAELRDRPDVEVLDDGRVLRQRPDGSYGDDCLWYPLQEAESVADLDAYPFPMLEEVPEPDDVLREKIANLKSEDTVVQAGVIQPFKKAWQLRGMERVLCDYLLAPEIVEAIYDCIYPWITAIMSACARAGVDVVCIVGDIGMQDRLLMSPELWRRFDKPRLTEAIRTVKQANPDVRVYMHSDGALTDIVGDLIEAGLDILNPIQPECMDPFAIKRDFGDRLAMIGGVSLQRTMPFGTPQQVRDEVRRLIDVCGRGGGYVVGPSNGLTEDIPVENVVAMYETVK